MIPVRYTASGFPVPSQQDLSRLGLPHLAYTHPVTLAGQAVWGIFQADGTQIGAAPSREIALAAMVQHELAPVSLH